LKTKRREEERGERQRKKKEGERERRKEEEVPANSPPEWPECSAYTRAWVCGSFIFSSYDSPT
jgi:hypothetical protein